MSEVATNAPAGVAGSAYTRRERGLIIAAAVSGWGMEYFDLVILSLVAGDVGKTFGVSTAAVGAVFTAQLAATAIGGILFGPLADRFGRRRVLTWTIWVFAIGTGLGALAPSFGLFVVCRMIAGIGIGGEWAIGFALLNEAWSPKRRGLAGGMVQAAIWPAYAIGIFVAGAVPNWRWAFAIGALPALAAVAIRLACPESKQWLELQRAKAEGRQAGTVVARESATAGLAMLFKKNALKMVVLGTVVVFGAQYSYYVYSSWMPTFLKTGLHLGAGPTQTVLYVSAAISLVSYIAAGALGDRWGRRKALLAFASVQLVAFIAFAVLIATGAATGAVIAMYFVISFGLGYFAVFGTWFGELFATPIRATGSSFCYSVGRGIASFGPGIVGLLAARYGLGGGISTGLFAVALMMITALFLADRSGRAITAVE
ncbi:MULTISPECIES: MFS transporter [unclassified Amycolatopsis]|uniref:MFS transporter n=1 Tax=unclassified Amycolatopsis TaxID=2618356 RepID=UPI001C6A273E|nr:MFS transporter [Amycolatopsis sp. DSM 110486]QYN18259.1 MFS transporter [Amycolatopsis sp. DSM 110486]